MGQYYRKQTAAGKLSHIHKSKQDGNSTQMVIKAHADTNTETLFVKITVTDPGTAIIEGQDIQVWAERYFPELAMLVDLIDSQNESLTENTTRGTNSDTESTIEAVESVPDSPPYGLDNATPDLFTATNGNRNVFTNSTPISARFSLQALSALQTQAAAGAAASPAHGTTKDPAADDSLSRLLCSLSPSDIHSNPTQQSPMHTLVNASLLLNVSIAVEEKLAQVNLRLLQATQQLDLLKKETQELKAE